MVVGGGETASRLRGREKRNLAASGRRDEPLTYPPQIRYGGPLKRQPTC